MSDEDDTQYPLDPDQMVEDEYDPAEEEFEQQDERVVQRLEPDKGGE